MNPGIPSKDKGWFVRVVPSFPAEHQEVVRVGLEKNYKETEGCPQKKIQILQ